MNPMILKRAPRGLDDDIIADDTKMTETDTTPPMRTSRLIFEACMASS